MALLSRLKRMSTRNEHAGASADRPPALSEPQRRAWEENGYLVLPRHFPPATVDAVNGLVDDAWGAGKPERTRTVVDLYLGTPREVRTTLCAAPADARRHPYKLNDLYLELEGVRNVVLEERLADVLAELLGAAPLVCNTLNLEYGSQQEFHTDSLYMAAPVGQHLVASWIALEDARPEAGLLQYYRGSHRIAPYLFSRGTTHAVADEMPRYRAYMGAEVSRRGLAVEQFHARAGDVLIWHSQLYHGGDAITDPASTRRSLVTHYWRACDLPGSHPAVGEGRHYLWRDPQPLP